MRQYKYIFLIIFIVISVVGLNPFHATIDPEKTLIKDNSIYPNEIRRLPDASYLVSVRTPMIGVEAKMVRWWFSDFLQTSEHYKWWHPTDHVWMDWENKVPGEIIGSSHLVHEYVGDDLSKLRIQFINPSELFGYDPNNKDRFVICARVGMLEVDINIAKMCHIVVNTQDGAEMRSRFWLGHVAKRSGDETVPSMLGFIGNTAISRIFAVNKKTANDLQQHAKEEMTFLAELLPNLYKSENSE